MSSSIRIIACRQGKAATIETLGAGLKAMQEFVGGYIERVPLDPTTALWCNEEGMLRNLPTQLIFGRVFYGDCFIAASNLDGELVDFTDKQLKHWMGKVQ